MVPATLLTALVLASAPGAERETLWLCGEPGAAENAAAVALSRWMRSARVEVHPCDAQAPSRRLVLTASAQRVSVQLHTVTRSREREVPWLEDTQAPLSRLRQRGLLARFSVLLEGLLAEDRLGDVDPVDPARMGPALVPGPTRAGASEARDLVPGSTLPGESVTQTVVEPAQEPASEPVPGPTRTGGIRGDVQVSEPVPGSTRPGGIEATDLVPGSTRPGASGTQEPAPSPSRPDEATVPTGAAPPSTPWPLGIEAQGGFRLRSPDFSCWEVGGALRWGPLSVGASYQPEAAWNLSGRTLLIDVIGFWVGGRFGLVSQGAFEAGVLASIRLDWLDLYRQDTRVHFDAIDAGVSAGVFGSLRLGPAAIDLRAEGVVMPTARLIEIPSGPGRRFNLFGLRLVLAAAWDVGD